MKRLILATAPFCFAACLAAGCGSNEAQPIETSVSDQDKTYEQQSLSEYGSSEYTKSISEETK